MNRQRQRGFTLIELSLVVIGMILLSAATMGTVIEGLREKQAQLTADEAVMLGQAAQAYRIDNSTWPDESHNCASALSVLSTNDYVAQVPPNTPFNTPWTFNCSIGGKIIDVTFRASSGNMAGYTAGLMPATTTSGTQITMAIPLVVPAHTTLLHRVSVSGQPQLNQMETSIDMNNYNLNNVATTNSTNVNSTTITNTGTVATSTLQFGTNGASATPDQGGSLNIGGGGGNTGTGSPYINFYYNGVAGENTKLVSDANSILDFVGNDFRASNNIEAKNNLVADNEVVATNSINAGTDVTAFGGAIAMSKMIQDVRVVQDGDLIPWPTCPSSLNKGVVFAAESMAQGGSPSDFYGWKAWATADTDNSSNWVANVRVFTAAGEVTPSAGYGRVSSFTYCY